MRAQLNFVPNPNADHGPIPTKKNKVKKYIWGLIKAVPFIALGIGIKYLFDLL